MENWNTAHNWPAIGKMLQGFVTEGKFSVATITIV